MSGLTRLNPSALQPNVPIFSGRDRGSLETTGAVANVSRQTNHLKRWGLSALVLLTGFGGVLLGRNTAPVKTIPSTDAATVVQTVHDGDTFTLSNGMKVRLNRGVDAIELKQPLGVVARDELARLIEGKAVDLECDDVSYDRNLCVVWVDDPDTPEVKADLDVNKAMLKKGYAFLDPRFKDQNPEKADYEAVQAKAKTNQEGACGDLKDCGQRPWTYRCDNRPTDSCLAIKE